MGEYDQIYFKKFSKTNKNEGGNDMKRNERMDCRFRIHSSHLTDPKVTKTLPLGHKNFGGHQKAFAVFLKHMVI